MDFMTLVLLVAVAAVGIEFNMVWLTVISVLVTAAYLFGVRKEERPVAAGGPKVRPIIVKRRYDGPASIYPSKMKIKVNPRWDTRDWWEGALGGAGIAAGMLAQLGRPLGRYQK